MFTKKKLIAEGLVIATLALLILSSPVAAHKNGNDTLNDSRPRVTDTGTRITIITDNGTDTVFMDGKSSRII